MRYRSKADLIARIEREHAEVLRLAAEFGADRFTEAGVWGDAWDVRDLLAHLTAWEQMFLGWHRDGVAGRAPSLPAAGYSWRETPALNRAIRERHHDVPVADVIRAFRASYAETLALVRSLSEADLFTPSRFPWTGRNALVTYVGANTASHYATAAKILRRALRGERRRPPARPRASPARPASRTPRSRG